AEAPPATDDPETDVALELLDAVEVGAGGVAVEVVEPSVFDALGDEVEVPPVLVEEIEPLVVVEAGGVEVVVVAAVPPETASNASTQTQVPPDAALFAPATSTFRV